MLLPFEHKTGYQMFPTKYYRDPKRTFLLSLFIIFEKSNLQTSRKEK